MATSTKTAKMALAFTVRQLDLVLEAPEVCADIANGTVSAALSPDVGSGNNNRSKRIIDASKKGVTRVTHVVMTKRESAAQDRLDKVNGVTSNKDNTLRRVPDLSKLWPDENWKARELPEYFDGEVDMLPLRKFAAAMITQSIQDVVGQGDADYIIDSLEWLNESTTLFETCCQILDSKPSAMREAIGNMFRKNLRCAGILSILHITDAHASKIKIDWEKVQERIATMNLEKSSLKDKNH